MTTFHRLLFLAVSILWTTSTIALVAPSFTLRSGARTPTAGYDARYGHFRYHDTAVSASAVVSESSEAEGEGIFSAPTTPLDEPTSSTLSSASPPRSSSGATAAVINLNARAVTPPLADAARAIFGSSNVYVTRTSAEASDAARAVLAGNYSLVVPVGGDGTVSGWINGMVDEIIASREERGAEEHGKVGGEGKGDGGNLTASSSSSFLEDAMRKLPAMGYIPMGTGNGLGYVVGCRIPSQSDEGWLASLTAVIGRRKKRRLERAIEVMVRLKEVGNAMSRQRDQHETGGEELEAACRIVEMPMIEVTHRLNKSTSASTSLPREDRKGDLCFFAGAGFDSLMLNDFKKVKAWSTRTGWFRHQLGSVFGYCVALVVKTLPSSVMRGAHKIRVDVTTRDRDALWVDHRRGDFAERAVVAKDDRSAGLGAAAAGEEATTNESGTSGGDSSSSASSPPPPSLLYSGSTGILAAGTTPYYGGGMRLFPYARLFPNKMHLRIGRISPLEGFTNILRIFEGSYREKSERGFGCLDFVGDDFEVEVRRIGKGKGEDGRKMSQSRTGGGDVAYDGDSDDDDPYHHPPGFPFQHSGESMGLRERFRLRVVKVPVRFISFLERRVVVE